MQRSVLDAGAEFLAAAGEGRIVQHIEVALGQLDEAEQALDRAEAGAEVERASVSPLPAPRFSGQGTTRFLGEGVHFLEIAEVLEPALAHIDADRVVNVPRQDQDLAPDATLSFVRELPAMLTRSTKEREPSEMLANEIDQARAGGRALGLKINVDVTGAIAIGDRFRIVFQSLWRNKLRLPSS